MPGQPGGDKGTSKNLVPSSCGAPAAALHSVCQVPCSFRCRSRTLARWRFGGDDATCSWGPIVMGNALSATLSVLPLSHPVPTKNSVLTETVELTRPRQVGWEAMLTAFLSLFCTVRSFFRIRAALHAEILALRHQLLVLQRSGRSRRPNLSATDRILWVLLSHLWADWRSVLLIVVDS